MGWKSLDDMDVRGKRVLVRVDINVPMEAGHITDTTRIDKILPTLNDILTRGGRPIILAHFGRPKGKVVPALSLKHVLPALQSKLHRSVELIATPEAAEHASDENVLLLENTRFHPGEETNDLAFAKQLATLGEIYCNDAFSAAHRAHASTEGVARLLPACAGRQMEAELRALEAALSDPTRPVGAVVGGAKVSTKIALLTNLVQRLDLLVIGGGMANTFLGAQGAQLGRSLQETDQHDMARQILQQAKQSGCRVLLPIDGAVATELVSGAAHELVPLTDHTLLAKDQMVLDAGPETIDHVTSALRGLKTLIWNGPLGAFETAPFDRATTACAREAAYLTRIGVLETCVAGGGDTIAALHHAEAAEHFTYLSTAGGAFLEWMEGKTLPGVAALEADIS
ncbi:MAG: phosphoglycerate kinase [Pseudomonadota bacterium]